MVAIKRPQRYLVTERNGRKIVTSHIVTIPGRMMKDGYRSITSLQAFRQDQFPYIMGDAEKSFDVRQAFDNRPSPVYNGKRWRPNAGCPIVRHSNLWDFYLAIGWNYKTKKFV